MTQSLVDQEVELLNFSFIPPLFFAREEVGMFLERMTLTAVGAKPLRGTGTVYSTGLEIDPLAE